MDMMKLMKQAQKLKKVQKEIEKTVVTEALDGASLSITGGGTVKNFAISEELYAAGREGLEKSITKLIAATLKKQQEMMKEKGKEAMGGMGLPDMLK